MKYLFFIVFFIISFNAFSQSNGYVNDFIDHWEDNFWWNETVERCYKEHTKAGEYVKYYKNGKIKWKGSCNDDGTPIRTWYYYNEKGELLWEGEYNGKFVEYYSYDGEKQDTALIGSYKDGLKNGEWIYYDNNYQGHYLSKKGNYLSGEPTGVWQHFKPLTFVTKTEKYQEYNYATETLTFFEKDSIKTKHIDSLNYDPEDYYNYRDDESNIQHFIFEFYHSTHVVDFKKVNDFYYDTISKKSLTGNLYSFGLGYSFHFTKKGVFGFNYFYTAPKKLQINDSIKLRVNGYNVNFNLGYDLIKKKVIDIYPSLGLRFQQTKLRVTKTTNPNQPSYNFGEEDMKIYKKPAIALNGLLTIRLNTEFITFSVTGGYSLDLTSNKWLYKNSSLQNSPSYKATGFIGIASLGFVFHD